MKEDPRSADTVAKRNIALVEALEHTADQDRTLGERVADGVAATVGSWPFIIVQSVLLGVWMALNAVAWIRHWDPYPFILLNLALSFQAAYASPIIMMSQNRAAKLADRRNKLDLQINLLAEQEDTETLRLLRLLCEKNGICLTADEEQIEALEQQTHPDRLVEEIDEEAREAKRREKGEHAAAKKGEPADEGDGRR